MYESITFGLGYVCKIGNLLYVCNGRMDGVAPLSINISIGVSFINIAVNMPLSLYSIVCYSTWLILMIVSGSPVKYIACGIVSISMSLEIW